MIKPGSKVKYIGCLPNWSAQFSMDLRDFNGIFEVIDLVPDRNLFIKSKYNDYRNEHASDRGLDVCGKYWCMSPNDFEEIKEIDPFIEKLDELFED